MEYIIISRVAARLTGRKTSLECFLELDFRRGELESRQILANNYNLATCRQKI